MCPKTRKFKKEFGRFFVLDPSVALRPQDDGSRRGGFIRRIQTVSERFRCKFGPVLLSGAKDPVEGIPLVSALRRYLRLFLGYQCLPPRPLHSPSRGAILILVACFLPVILVGIKYSEKLFQSKDQELKKTSTAETTETLKKRCAREAALAVAQNWNPGLTLAQQQEAVYKVADAVYNASPGYRNSVLGGAIPGILVNSSEDDMFSSGGSSKQVEYKTDNAKYFYLWYFNPSYATWNPHYVLWLSADKVSEASKRQSKFDEMNADKLNEGKFVLDHHEIYINPLTCSNAVSSGYPTDSHAYGNTMASVTVNYNAPSTSTSTAGNYSICNNLSTTEVLSTCDNSSYKLADSTYSTRIAPSGTDYVSISIDNDRIKVRTDDQEGYAVPAQCNVDIVLAVPVNGATNSRENLDLASPRASNPYGYGGWYQLPNKEKETPIYQMGQALKNFVKDNFYHIRGVNMALIPYSGRVSISPDQATAWTVACPTFVNTATNSTPLMIGACLYGTSGVEGASLNQSAKTTALVTGDTLPTTDTPYYWGGVLTGCPIMFRAGYQQTETKYGGNSYFRGFLANYSQSGSALSSTYTDPSKGASYKYLRMNLNPCYVGSANMLSMKCDKKCTHFLPNPYYMIEPTADLVKIYEMCNALCPICDHRNVSNFIFIPLEWAYNMFQTWTKNTNCSAKSGSGLNSSSVDDGATLSRPSKTTSGRKKAVILLVNKPDWFEPGEMTYLGFNNDKSEVPTVLSDKIDFSINYNNTQYAVDGSTYTGPKGPNKILSYSLQSGSVSYDSTAGYYTSPDTSKIRLSFPHKGLLQLKVAPAPVIVNTYTITDCNSLAAGTSKSNGALTFKKFAQQSGTFTLPDDANKMSYIHYTGNKFFAGRYSSNILYWSTTGTSWNQVTMPCDGTWSKVCYGDNKCIAINNSKKAVAYSTTGTGGWQLTGYTLPKIDDNIWGSICYGNGKFVVTATANATGVSLYSTTGTNSWNTVSLPTTSWYSVTYANNIFFATSLQYMTYSTTGTSWASAISMNYNGGNSRSDPCYGNGRVVTVVMRGSIAQWSTTGSTWTNAALPQDPNSSSSVVWVSVCYGKDKFVATAASTKHAAYSTTGTGNWTAISLPYSGTWYKICYGDNKFITYSCASGNYEGLYSTDGIHWSTDGSSYQLSFGSKGKINITTTGSGTLTFKSGVSGTTSYSVSGTQTTEIESSRLTGSSLKYLLSEGVYTTTVSRAGADSQAKPARLYSTTGNKAVWAIKNSSGTVTTQAVTFSSSYKDSKGYYKELPSGYSLVRAATGVSKTETVYDMIDFTSRKKKKNGKLSSTFSGTNTGGLYTVTSASGKRITTAVRGTIELTVMPKLDVNSGSITTKYGSNTSARTVSGKMTITIPPSDMKKSGTSYYMDFNATNIVLLNAKLVKWELEFTKPALPSLSSYVDFSQMSSSKPVHASTSLAVFGKDTAGNLGTISYDSNVGYWCATGVNNNFFDMQPYAKGDGYLLVEDLSTSLKTFDISYGVSGTKASRWNHYLPGLTRLYFDATQMNPSNGFSSAGKHAFLIGGITQPINAALYNYVYGTGSYNLNSYVSPSSDFNRAALRALTTAACAKLKTDLGTDNVRVYVIKYRKQDNWGALTRNGTSAHSSTSTAHSYTEIDNCATSTGGTAYDVTTEADLKTKLDAIAAAIKDWAEYEEAKNVEAE